MRQQRPPRPKKGDPVTAKWANELVDHIERNAPMAGPGLEMMQTTKGGTVLSVMASPDINVISAAIVTTGGITARSGTTPGTGNITFVYYDTDTQVLTQTGDSTTIYSISSTTGGVPQDTYVMVGKDVNGIWWLISVDCGN